MNIASSNLHPSNFHLFSEAHAQVGLSDPASPDRLHAAGDTLRSSMHPDGCMVGKYMTTNCRKAARWLGGQADITISRSSLDLR